MMLAKWFTGLTALTLLMGTTAIAGAEETKAGSADLFKQLDSNNDGQIKKDELNEKQVKFFDRLVRTGDKNKDGELSKAEFTAALNQKEQPVKVQGGGKGRRRNFNPEMLFKRLDKNSDGKLTQAELPEKIAKRLAPLFQKSGKEELTLAEFSEAAKRFRGKSDKKERDKRDPKKLFERFDQNKDGKLTLEEIPEKLQRRMKPIFEKLNKDAFTLQDLKELQSKRDQGNKGKGKGTTRGFLKRFDKNGDGKIQKEEAPEKLKRVFDKIDANSDGILDEAEIKKARERRGRPNRKKGKRSDKKKRTKKSD